MNEILCRGRGIETDWRGEEAHGHQTEVEWYYGNYICTDPETYIMDDTYRTETDEGGYLIIKRPRQVDPQTIGLCTWQKDKNGKLIFDGDILKTETGCTLNHKYLVVHWVEPLSGFYKTCVSNVEIPSCRTRLSNTEDYEVIGNIHLSADRQATTPSCC